MGLIQTPGQLKFSYAAIIKGAKTLLSNNVVTNTNSQWYNVISFSYFELN